MGFVTENSSYHLEDWSENYESHLTDMILEVPSHGAASDSEFPLSSAERLWSVGSLMISP